MPVGGNALMTPNSIKLHLSRNLRTICGLWLRIDAKKPAPHAPATQHNHLGRDAPTQETEVARARFRQPKQSAPLKAARTGHHARAFPDKAVAPPRAPTRCTGR